MSAVGIPFLYEGEDVKVNNPAQLAYWRSLPPFSDWPAQGWQIQTLSGLSHAVYKVSSAAGCWVVRCAGGQDAQQVAVEQHNLQIAARYGLTVAPVYQQADGLLVLPWLDGYALRAEQIRSPQYWPQVCALVQRLHRLPEVFQARIALADSLQHYCTQLQQAGRCWTRAQVDQIAQAQQLLAQLPVECACHGDLVAANVYYSAEQVYLLDWEYSTQGAALWDVLMLAQEVQLDAQQLEQLGFDGQTSLWRAYQGAYALLSALWAECQFLHQRDQRLQLQAQRYWQQV